jgi:hypothetical protein
MYAQHGNGILSQQAAYSPNTNTHPAFGNVFKVERNRALTRSIMRLNYGVWTIGQGVKPIETFADPRRRKPQDIIRRGREEMSIAGRSRGAIRAAAPGQVAWKYPYWTAQRPPVRQPIGPFVQGSLERQSIWYRMSGFLSRMNGG